MGELKIYRIGVKREDLDKVPAEIVPKKGLNELEENNIFYLLHQAEHKMDDVKRNLIQLYGKRSAYIWIIEEVESKKENETGTAQTVCSTETDEPVDLEEDLFQLLRKMGEPNGHKFEKEDLPCEMLSGILQKVKESVCEWTNGFHNFDEPYLNYKLGDKVEVGPIIYRLVYIEEISRYAFLEEDTGKIICMSGDEGETIEEYIPYAYDYFWENGKGFKMKKVTEG